MMGGYSANLQEISDCRKTAIINNELSRLNVDIATLQETRLPDSGSIKEKEYTFYWHGKGSDERREHGVGFAVKNNLVRMIEPGSYGSERLLTIRLNTTDGPVTIISVYAPTLNYQAEEKDQFYEQLSDLVRSIPKEEQLFLLGDFNARVGNDNESWSSCLGKFGEGKMNENGQRLLELCTIHNLCITNSFFQTKPQHKVSWMHPRSKRWHQLDLIITRRPLLKNILLSRTYHSADCDSDHSLVCCKVKLRPKKFYIGKPKGAPRIETSTMNHFRAEEFRTEFEKDYNVDEGENTAKGKWQHLQQSIHKAAMKVFGKKTHKTQDWFEAKTSELTPVLDAKRTALKKFKASPCEKNLQILKSARSKAQSTARRCANEYWQELSANIQVASYCGNIKGMYDGIKKALGPTQTKTAPLKSTTGETITDKKKQLERWVEHYSELYSRETKVSDSALDAIDNLPIMEDLDDEPTVEELSKAIDKLSAGKAPGSDGIPPDLIKECKGSLLTPLHNILCLCWKEGTIPQDLRDAKITTIYKNKGDRSDCNNYRGISLLNIVGKAFARVALIRLQALADRIYPESQCGFRSERSTIDMIFSLRQLQEKCREQRVPLYISFIDLTKAFDLVSRDGLFKILPKIGCPPKLANIIQSFHNDMKGTVLFNGNSSDPFPINNGVKQGCVLAPTLFGIFFSLVLKHAFGNSLEGVFLRTRFDGKLFNLSRLKANTKVTELLIRDLLFADDAAVATHSEQSLQNLMKKFSDACDNFGLTISLKKTEILTQEVETPPAIKIGDHQLSVVEQFTYLGSTITGNLSLDKELDKRIGKATSTMARLTTKVWSNADLTLKTKMAVYKACVLSILLYGSEAWTTYARQEKRLNVFHMRNLRRILNITWQEKIPNADILARANVPSIFTLLKQRRLRWLGHVRRMGDHRLPKSILYGELCNGNRATGRPKLRYKDVVKKDMKDLGINIADWEDEAADRPIWRATLTRQLKEGEEKLREAWTEKRQRRKEEKDHPQTTTYACNDCGKLCLSRIGLFSHRKTHTKDTNP